MNARTIRLLGATTVLVAAGARFLSGDGPWWTTVLWAVAAGTMVAGVIATHLERRRDRAKEALSRQSPDV